MIDGRNENARLAPGETFEVAGDDSRAANHSATGNIVEALGGPIHYIPPRQVDLPEVQLRDAIERAGLTPPSTIHLDGVMHRFDADPKGGKSGWYIAYGDGVPAGSFGCWRSGIESGWQADIGRDLTDAEIAAQRKHLEEARRVRERERAEQYAAAAEACRAIWASAPPAPADHPYLVRKRIQPHHARVHADGRLILPLIRTGELVSLQYIDRHGGKLYHAGGAAAGTHCTIDGTGSTVYVAEGFATAATIAETTGCTVVIAYSANQLGPATAHARTIANDVVVVADNDESGVGEKAARAAAVAHGARWCMPPTVGQDANDYALAGGDLKALLREAKHETRPRLSAPVNELMKGLPPQRWLVSGLIPKESVVFIFGKPEAGKSFIAIDLAVSVATGEDWIGRRVRSGKPGGVLILAGEGRDGIVRRFMALKQETGIDLSKARINITKNTIRLTEDGQTALHAEIDALTEEWGEPPAMVIVDTLARHIAGDENKTEDGSAYVDAVTALQDRYHCAVVNVHHPGLGDSKRMRGSSAFNGAADVELEVEAKTVDGVKTITLKSTKTKDTASLLPVQFQLKPVTLEGRFDEDGEPETSAVAVYVGEASADAEPASAAPKKVDKSDRRPPAWQRFYDAWLLYGDAAPMVGDESGTLYPRLTRSALKHFHEEVLKTPPQNVNRYGNRDGAELLTAGWTREVAHGWIVVRAAECFAMRTAKPERFTQPGQPGQSGQTGQSVQSVPPVHARGEVGTTGQTGQAPIGAVPLVPTVPPSGAG